MSISTDIRILLEAIVIEAAAIVLAFATVWPSLSLAWLILTVPVSVWIAGRSVRASFDPPVPFCLLAGVLIGFEVLITGPVTSLAFNGFHTGWGGMIAFVFLVRESVVAMATLVVLPAFLGFLFSKVALLRE